MPILKTGTFRARNGKQVTFDEAALDRIIQNTDLSKEPQFVIEHPFYDKIGFGTIAALKRVGKYLFALPKQVDEKFKNAVNSGELPGRSVSIDENTFALNHIGFLPKEIKPAVDGLGAYTFSSDNNTIKLSFELQGTESHFAEISTDKYEFADSNEEKKKAQIARSIKYNIGIKDNGNLTKPAEYENIDDDEFADPVNYKYPIDAEHIKAALSYWGMDKNRDGYTEEEIKIITKRILTAAKKYGIEVDKSKWEFAQYEISRWPFMTIKNLFRNLKNAWIEKFGKEEADKLFNEYDLEGVGATPEIFVKSDPETEINNQFSTNKKGEQMKIDLSKLDPELSALIKQLEAELAQTKNELQNAKINLSAAEAEKNRNEVLSFCESAEMKLKILPSEKEKIVNLLLAVKEKGNLEFSNPDNNTKIQFNAYEYLKELLKHLPDKIELSEMATNKSADNKLADYQLVAKQIIDAVKVAAVK